ncbi:hypothetical protein INT47_009959 [Mucor saturninus]|uniref:HSF-type DNA-binding domain-containing protein n=1 Tax=Mucor saturninus TaxID=64648 RepID=A0A8H7UXL4_9FUNG|nr:hypothetical protein INT47_009959 [Mucor saturninus]
MSKSSHNNTIQTDCNKRYKFRPHRNILPSTGSSSNHPNTAISSVNKVVVDSENLNGSHKRYTKQGVSTFIKKLYSMINDTHNQHLISWNPSGTSFFVRDVNRFANEVLSEYFKHSNFSSFVRQLNMYGFHKINKSHRGHKGESKNELWEFSHPNFQRGRPELLGNIKRKAMESGLLQKETGNIHASFALIQTSQADLLLQFRHLQENFANLLQGFQDLKKVQIQQQIIIGQLAERQGIAAVSTPLNSFDNNSNHPSVFVTSPASASTWNSQPQKQQDLMISSLNQNQPDQLLDFNSQMDMTDAYPPSPAPSILTSPSSPYNVEHNYKQNLPEPTDLNLGYPHH